MTTIAKSDIFFLIASSGIVVVSILIVIALVQIIKLLKTIQKVSNSVQEEGVSIISDLRELRQSLKAKGQVIGSLATLTGIAKIVKKTVTKKQKK